MKVQNKRPEHIPPPVVVNVTMSHAMVEALDQLGKQLGRMAMARPSGYLTRADVIRLAVEAGLGVLEGDGEDEDTPPQKRVEPAEAPPDPGWQ